MLNRRLASSSSSDHAIRPTRPIPCRARRLRKAQRISSSHCVAGIEASSQRPRVVGAVTVEETSDTDVSSSDTELGTALSEIEAAVQNGKGRMSSSPTPNTPDRYALSSPERDGDEVDETLGRAPMSPSPGPGRDFWSSGSSKTPYVIPVSPVSRGSRDKEGSDRKRRRVEVEDEADDEMEAENLLITPKPKTLRKREKHAPTALTATPSILGLTARLHGLTPYSMEMQTSPDQVTLDGHVAVLVSEQEARLALKLEAERTRSWAPCPLTDLPVLDTFEGFDLSVLPAASEAPADTAEVSSWRYGPLSSPIHLPGDSPRAPITHRILLGSLAGQRTRPNKNLQRRSPTSLVPLRRPKGRKFQSDARCQARRAAYKLPSLCATPPDCQQVITQIQLSNEARRERYWAMHIIGTNVNFAAVSGRRNRCLDSLNEMSAWQSLLADIAADCWWWPRPAPAPPTLALSPQHQAHSRAHFTAVPGALRDPHEQLRYPSDEVQVEALVATAYVHPEPVRQVAIPLRNQAVSVRQGIVPSTAGRLRPSARHSRIPGPGVTARIRPDQHAERLLHATAAEQRARRDTARAAMRQAVALVPSRPRPMPLVPDIRQADLEDPAAVNEPIDVEDTDSDSESVVSEPPAYNSALYPRHIPCPSHLRPRRPPAPVEIRLPSYITNRYSRRSPSPPPPYNARTDRETLVEPRFIDSDDEDEVVREVAAVAEAIEPRMIGAFPSGAARATASASPDWTAGRNRFDAALDMEEADADLIDELTGGFGLTADQGAQAGQDRAEESTLGAIGGFLGRWFGLG